MEARIGKIKLNTILSEADQARFQDSRQIQKLLRESKTIAVVGLSTDKTKASNMVASYLKDSGYTIVPVHPSAEELLGEKVYRSISEIPFSVDTVDIFRPSDEVDEIVKQAIANGAKAVWQQLRIINLPAAEQALAAGMIAIVDKCIKMEHGRYGGMLHLAGMNTEIITARRTTQVKG